MKKSIILFFLLSCFFTILLSKYLFSENKVITDVKKWEYVETEHFRIYHYPEEKDLLPLLSNILEDAFNTTTRFYEYSPSKKTMFFIYRNHNEFEQTNIVDVGEGTGGVTEAYKNRLLVFNDGSVRWLQDVIHHEFTHVIQYSILYEESPILKALRLARGIFIPLWMMEGMAEHNTADYDATQEEMVIRDMVASRSVISLENLSTFDALKPHQITPAYKLAESAYRFMVDEYGPDKPAKMLKVLRDTLDVNIAFEDTLKISPDLFMKKWKEWLYEQYEDKVEGFKEAKDYGKQLTFDNGDNIPDFNTNPAVSPDGKSIAFISDDDGVNKLVMMSLADKKKIVLAEGNNERIDVIHNDGVSFSPDGNLLAFAGEKLQKDHIYIYDIKNAKLSKVPLNIFTVQSPSFSPDGKKILFVGMEKTYNDIYEYSFETKTTKRITYDPENQTSPKYSPDGNYITFSQEDSITTYSHIYVYDIRSQKRTRLTDFAGDESQPVFSTDNKQIFFTADKKRGSPVNIYSVNIDGTGIKRCTNLLTGAFDPCLTPDGKSIVFEYYRDFRKDIYVADIAAFGSSSVEQKQEEFTIEASTENKYLALHSFPYRFRPSLDILVPFVIYSSDYGLFLATYWQASDDFGDHQLTNQLLYSSGDGELQYTVTYSFLKWRPQFFLSSVGANTEFLANNQDIYRDKENAQLFGVVYPLDRFNSITTTLSTEKETEVDETFGNELLYDERANIYSVMYERNTITGKYLYARFGSDLQLIFNKAFLDYGGEIQYQEYMINYQKYFPMFSQSALVVGGVYSESEGPDQRYFRLPLRGFPSSDASYIYSRLIAATLEYRYPLLTLEDVWPTSDLFLKSIVSFFFTDNGFGFNSLGGYQNITLNQIENSIGTGLTFYTFLAGYELPLTVDYAKRTDNKGESWDFAIGITVYTSLLGPR